MAGQVNAGTRASLWNAVVQAKQDYAHSLASLDALVLSGASPKPSPAAPDPFEEAAKARQAAYARYRRAMDDLTDGLCQ